MKIYLEIEIRDSMRAHEALKDAKLLRRIEVEVESANTYVIENDSNLIETIKDILDEENIKYEI